MTNKQSFTSYKNLPFSKEISVSSDDRGIFAQFIDSDNELPSRKDLSIKRVYYVYNFSRGIIRGFHYHQKEWKYFFVVLGAAKIIAINPKKPKEKFIFVASTRKPLLVIIPPGFANGWVSLENQTILVCGSTSSLEESIKDDKRFNPYKWGDIWKIIPR